MPRVNSVNSLSQPQQRGAMSPAQINPGVSNEIVKAGRAWQGAMESIGDAFSSLAGKAAATDSMNAGADATIAWDNAVTGIENEATKNADERGSSYGAVPQRLNEARTKVLEQYGSRMTPRDRKQFEVRSALSANRVGQWAFKNKLSSERGYFGGVEARSQEAGIMELRQTPNAESFNRVMARQEQRIRANVGALYTEEQAVEKIKQARAAFTAELLKESAAKDPRAAARLLSEIERRGKFAPDKERAKIDTRPAASVTIFGGGTKAPTSHDRRRIARAGGVVVNLDTNWSKSGGQTTPMVVIPDGASKAQRDAANAYAARIAEVYKEKFGKSLAPRVVTRSQNGRGRAHTIHTEPYAVTDAQAVKYFSSDEGKAQHASILSETLGKIPGVQFALPHGGLDGKDKGAHGSGTNEVELAYGVLQRLGAGNVKSSGKPVDGEIIPPEPKPAPVPYGDPEILRATIDEKKREVLARIEEEEIAQQEGAGSEGNVEQVNRLQAEIANYEKELAAAEKAGYTGGDTNLPTNGMDYREMAPGQSFTVPLQGGGAVTMTSEMWNSLSAKDLKSISRDAALRLKAHVKSLGEGIKDFEETAVKGFALPGEKLQKLRQSVEGFPALKQRFTQAEALLTTIRTLRSQPPVAVEAFVNRVRETLSATGATPDQLDKLKSLETMLGNQKSMLRNDSLTWAHKSGTMMLRPLKLGDPASMAQRLRDSATVSARFDVEGHFFTDVERKNYAAKLESGELKITQVAGVLMKEWGSENGLRALKELSDNAPQAALVGSHYMKLGDTPFARDYEAGLKLRQSKDFKPVDLKMADVRAAMDGVLGEALNFVPSASDTIRGAVNIAYEERARRAGKKSFDADLYTKVVKEAIGERTINGRRYGGIGQSQDGWFSDSDPVIVPHDVASDYFDDLRGLVKVEHLPSAPRLMNSNETGRPISDDEFQDARLISIGNGRYWLARSVADGNAEFYADESGNRYVFDFASVRGRLKAQRPDLFAE